MGKAGAQKTTGLVSMTERDFQDMVVEFCKWSRLLCYHTFDSRRSERGFPDLVIVGKRTIFVELKSETGRVSHPQREWIERLIRSGQHAYLWRPSDWEEAQTILRTLL